MGVHHGLSQLLGGRTGIPHGLANALVLPHALRFNAPVVPEAMAAIGHALGDRRTTRPPPSSACAPGSGSRRACSDVGVTEDDLDAVARLSQGSAAVQRNPRPVTEADARGDPRRRLVDAGALRPTSAARTLARTRTWPATGSTSTIMPSCELIHGAPLAPDDRGDAELAGEHRGVAQRAALDGDDALRPAAARRCTPAW